MKQAYITTRCNIHVISSIKNTYCSIY